MTSYEHEKTVIRKAARLAGQLCMAVRDEMLKSGDKLEKAGREPVTIADYGAQAIVLRQIMQSFPEDGSIAEERASEFSRLVTAEQQSQIVKHISHVLEEDAAVDDILNWLDFGHGKEASRIWVVDPIDGTKGFLRGDQFAVAIALLVDGKPVAGALACPMMPYDDNDTANARGAIAITVKGDGAFAEPIDGEVQRQMQVSAQASPESIRMVESVEVGHTDHSFSAQIMEATGINGASVRIDSQAKYFAVADGRAEVYIRNSRTEDYREKIWDHAAGVLIVEEAGGRVTDLDGKKVEFNHGPKMVNNRGILATNGPIHEALLKAIAEYQTR